MKPIVKKILDMNLLTKDIVQSLESWGMLPNGTSDKISDVIQDIPNYKLAMWAEELAEELEKEYQIRETNLDLSRLRWPVKVSIRKFAQDKHTSDYVVDNIEAVIDTFGKYYFRIQDVKEEWFIPGYLIVRGNELKVVKEIIAERQILYMDDIPVCVQVTVLKEV